MIKMIELEKVDNIFGGVKMGENGEGCIRIPPIIVIGTSPF